MQRGDWLNLQPKFPHLEAFNGDGEVFWLLTHNFSFLVFIFWVYFPWRLCNLKEIILFCRYVNMSYVCCEILNTVGFNE